MDDSFGQILYFMLLLLAIGGSYVISNRRNLGKTLQQGLIWGLIFVGVIAAAGLWDDMRDDVIPRQSVVDGTRIEVPRGIDGHYHLSLAINGAPIRFVVDTGASDIVLSQQDAKAAGIDPTRLAYLGRAQTANGTVPIAQVTLDSVTLGGFVDRNVGASVNGGEMFGSLLGMRYLERYGRIEISGGRLILER
ncbi:retropepsin-like aspartic protease family protein [Oceaniglobus ichthyenteri]|uniref:retropepsin-like aspartic protease family protein n=1 Tax=Oceaniglobus ichthyenteri TaxID=2136177 RepID=UPI0030B81FEC